MFSHNQIKKRKLIYNKISKFDFKSKENLVFIKKNQFHSEIVQLVNLFLDENLNTYFNKKYINLKSSINHIIKLPNITPNGILYPKKETQLIYNLIVYYISKSLNNVLDCFEFIALPKIRIKSGNNYKNTRPYSTEKLHAECWYWGPVSHSGDAIVNFGIAGDFKNNGLELFYANKVSKKFFHKIDNYDLGLSTFEKKKKIATMKEGFITIFDHTILHKTISKKKSLPRISIDFVVKIKRPRSKKLNLNKKSYDYFETKIYKELGINSFIDTNERISEVMNRLNRGKIFIKSRSINF